MLANVCARIPSCENAADLEPEELLLEIEQMARDFRLPHDAISTDAYF